MMTDSPLNVREIRSEDAEGRTPVVLIHGMAASAEADYLSTGWPTAFDDRDVFAVDLPGHGSSPAIDSVESGRTTAIVQHLVSTIRAHADGPVDVIAYSLGARLAWELPTAAPGLVRRLVLGGLSPVEPFAAVDMAALRQAAGLEAGEQAEPDPLTGMMAGMISAPGSDTASLANLIGGLAAEPFDPQAAAPTVPTLLVAGGDDAMSKGVDDLAALLPDGRRLTVPGDHRGALDSAEFRAAAVEFLS